MRHFYVNRNEPEYNFDNVIISENQLYSTLKRHKSWRIVEEVFQGATVTPILPIEPQEVVPTGVECPLCNRMFKSELSLKVHKGHKHK